MRASCGALRQSSSQPVRILTVTGTSTASTTACMIAVASASSRISAEPDALRTIFLAGQPKLMSTISAPRPATTRAASAITSGSVPASCTAIGPISPVILTLRSDWRVWSSISRLATISENTSPALYWRASRRNGWSVTPDRGARKTRLAMVTPPIDKGSVMLIF